MTEFGTIRMQNTVLIQVLFLAKFVYGYHFSIINLQLETFCSVEFGQMLNLENSPKNKIPSVPSVFSIFERSGKGAK
jgi:hypothetical protein